MSQMRSRGLITGATIGGSWSLRVNALILNSGLDGSMEMSKDEKIRMLEEKLQEMHSQRVSKTTGASYG